MDGGNGWLVGSLGFQLVIEAISTRVIVLMGFDGVGAICLADRDEDEVKESGRGPNPPCQVQSTVDACVDVGV